MPNDDTSQSPAPSEPAQPVSEAAPESSAPAEVQQPPETQTAQIPASEPLPSEPEPIAAQTPMPAPVVAAPTKSTNFARDLLNKARAAIQSRKQKKLEKILEFLNTKGKISNDEVEKLLHVSDATATRYLSALEKDGKIKQVGRTGKAVTYTKS